MQHVVPNVLYPQSFHIPLHTSNSTRRMRNECIMFHSSVPKRAVNTPVLQGTTSEPCHSWIQSIHQIPQRCMHFEMSYSSAICKSPRNIIRSTSVCSQMTSLCTGYGIWSGQLLYSLKGIYNSSRFRLCGAGRGLFFPATPNDRPLRLL